MKTGPALAKHHQRVSDPGALAFGAEDQRISIEFLHLVIIVLNEFNKTRDDIDGRCDVRLPPVSIASSNGYSSSPRSARLAGSSSVTLPVACYATHRSISHLWLTPMAS